MASDRADQSRTDVGGVNWSNFRQKKEKKKYTKSQGIKNFPSGPSDTESSAYWDSSLEAKVKIQRVSSHCASVSSLFFIWRGKPVCSSRCWSTPLARLVHLQAPCAIMREITALQGWLDFVRVCCHPNFIYAKFQSTKCCFSSSVTSLFYHFGYYSLAIWAVFTVFTVFDTDGKKCTLLGFSLPMLPVILNMCYAQFLSSCICQCNIQTLCEWPHPHRLYVKAKQAQAQQMDYAPSSRENPNRWTHEV